MLLELRDDLNCLRWITLAKEARHRLFALIGPGFKLWAGHNPVGIRVPFHKLPGTVVEASNHLPLEGSLPLLLPERLVQGLDVNIPESVPEQLLSLVLYRVGEAREVLVERFDVLGNLIRLGFLRRLGSRLDFLDLLLESGDLS